MMIKCVAFGNQPKQPEHSKQSQVKISDIKTKNSTHVSALRGILPVIPLNLRLRHGDKSPLTFDGVSRFLIQTHHGDFSFLLFHAEDAGSNLDGGEGF